MESKRKKQKSNKFPETELSFYIKLYCKQKGSSDSKFQSKLIEATKSWLSLTEEQREQVHKTYKEKERRFKLQCFDQLKNAEPFMKVKDPTGLENADLKSIDIVIDECEVQEEECANQVVNDEDIQLCYDEDSVVDIIPEHDQEPNESARDLIHSDEETPRTFLIEPLPPTLKTSKDLYYMLNPAGETDSVSWTTLSNIEKKQYTRALTLLKMDYITKYKEYLESLTERELFDYYNKTLF